MRDGSRYASNKNLSEALNLRPRILPDFACPTAIARLIAAGYCVKTCYNWEEARDTLIAYLDGKL